MEEKSASEQIEDIIKLYGGWKGEIISDIRQAIKEADPDIVEEIKWRMKTRPGGLPVWSHSGIVCLCETFKNDIKLVFTKGVHMSDSMGAFNARLNSSKDRAIEFHEGDKVNQDIIKSFVIQAIDLNLSKSNKN